MCLEANGRLERSNNTCLWPECLVEAAAKHFGGLKLVEAATEQVEAAAEDLRHLKACKRQA